MTGCATIGEDLGSLRDSLMPVTPAQAARMMADPYDPDNRRRGTVLIANSPFGGADPYLAMYRDRARHEPDPLVRAASIAALGRYGRPEDAALVAESLEHDRFQVRWEAAKALQRVHNPQVVPDLLRVLLEEGEQTDIRVAAAVALGQYPQDNVFQGLVGALEAPELAVNLGARESLTTLTGEDFGLDSHRWLAWYRAAEAPFAGRREYLYPTYQRRETWLEKLAFWSSRSFEKPGTPAGLRPQTRRTYQDDEPPEHETGG